MTILRSTVALVMVGLAIFAFLGAVTLNRYFESMNVAELALTVNFLVVFSVLLMAVGIYLAIFNKRTIHRRGHHFQTMPRRRA